MTFPRHLRAAACLCAIALNLVSWGVLLLVLLPAKAAPRTRPWFRRASSRIYRAAVRVDNALLRRISGAAWRVKELTLDEDRPHIAVANHRSWADILIVQSVVTTRGPIVKFLCKRELLHVPIFGLIILAFDFPVLRRRKRQGTDPPGGSEKGRHAKYHGDRARRENDRHRVREAAAVLLDSPAAILSFAEGTRFSEARREGGNAPYDHLLPPRAGGLAAMIEALASGGGMIVDLTLAYPRACSFWEFLGGTAGPVEVAWETVPIASVEPEHVQDWLNDCWLRKDARLQNALHTQSLTDTDSDLANLSEME